jgi:hypothetical protein
MHLQAGGARGGVWSVEMREVPPTLTPPGSGSVP